MVEFKIVLDDIELRDKLNSANWEGFEGDERDLVQEILEENFVSVTVEKVQ